MWELALRLIVASGIAAFVAFLFELQTKACTPPFPC